MNRQVKGRVALASRQPSGTAKEYYTGYVLDPWTRIPTRAVEMTPEKAEKVQDTWSEDDCPVLITIYPAED